ncbi:MAG TPA: hypothetical protein VF407_08740, partial [Polyangiaceae bacterium]
MNDDVFDEMNVVGHAFEIGFPKQTRVHVERRMLTIGQDAPIPPERILRAYFVPKRGQRPRVFVDVKRGRQIHVDVLTRDEGTRLLRALGWANDQRSIRFTGKPTTIGLVFAVAIGGLLLNGLGYFIGHFVNLLTLVAWTGLMYWSFRPRIDIGADGITIHQYFRKRFVSYRIVDRVRLLLQSSSTRNGGTVFEHFLVLE